MVGCNSPEHSDCNRPETVGCNHSDHSLERVVSTHSLRRSRHTPCSDHHSHCTPHSPHNSTGRGDSSHTAENPLVPGSCAGTGSANQIGTRREANARKRHHLPVHSHHSLHFHHSAPVVSFDPIHHAKHRNKHHIDYRTVVSFDRIVFPPDESSPLFQTA